MKKFPVIKEVFILLLAIQAFGTTVRAGDRRTIFVNGVKREYIIYKPVLPPDKRYPVVLDFHGAKGTAEGSEKFFGFDNIAKDKRFIAIYPEGIKKGWNDGRIDGKLKRTSDDVRFISELIDFLIKNENADSSRIYATGISNGAFFSIYLAAKLGNKIKAIAAVCGNILEEHKDDFTLPRPISLLLINGTEDPLVKYNGGAIVSERADRGRSTSTDFTIAAWLKQDNISTSPVIEAIPDIDKNDDCTATRYTYKSKKNNTTVVLIKIENGGHTWPGGKQYLPQFIIGKVCRDFNASEVIWSFFEEN